MQMQMKRLFFSVFLLILLLLSIMILNKQNFSEHIINEIYEVNEEEIYQC